MPIGLPIDCIAYCLSINCLLPIALPTGLALAWGDRLGFGLGGQGSWARPAWVWLGGPRVLGRAGLVYNTLNKHDSDEDVNIIPLRNMTVMRMLI